MRLVPSAPFPCQSQRKLGVFIFSRSRWWAQQHVIHLQRFLKSVLETTTALVATPLVARAASSTCPPPWGASRMSRPGMRCLLKDLLHDGSRQQFLVDLVRSERWTRGNHS